MSQSGYTPILVYASGTATNVPLAANLTSSASGAELALNYTDGKLYYKNNSGVVTLLASSAANAPVLTFSAGTTGFTPSTATSGAITLAGTLVVGNGGTNITTYTTGDILYASATNVLSKLTAGTVNYVLTSGGAGVAPSWVAASGGVTTFNGSTTGLTPATATSGAITLGGTLAVANGGTGVTTSTGSGANALATSPTLVTPILGTPTSGVLTNCTGTASGLTAGNISSSATITTPIIVQSINAQTTTAYVTVASDAGAIVTVSNASANTFKLPTNASVAYAIGSTITLIQIGAGATTISAVTPGTTTVLSTGATAASPVLAQYKSATCIKTATDTWYVVGALS